MKNMLMTSEFWVTITGTLISLAVMSGKLTPGQASEVAETVVSIVGSVITLFSTFGIVKHRADVKKAVFEAKVNAYVGRVKPGELSASDLSTYIDDYAKDL